jgi:uncharacterized membrane protein required for colicin V production
MSFLLDLIIIAIISLTIYFSYKNGFIKTAISAAAFMIAIIITVSFASPLAEAIKDTSVAETVKDAVEETIENALNEKATSLNDLLSGGSEKFNSMLNIAGLGDEDLSHLLAENSDGIDPIERIAAYVANPVIDIIAMIVAIILLYVGSRLLLLLVSFILGKVAELPVIRTANKGLGIALGVVLALFRVFLFCFAMNVLIEHADFFGGWLFGSFNPDNTLLFSLFSNIDIFSFFL